MKQNGRRPRIRGEIRIVNRDELRQMIDKMARKQLGLSGQEVLERIKKGRAGDNNAWTHLSMLANMLR